MAFRDELGKRVLFLDGGMGSLLQEKGLKAGELPELWNLYNPEPVYQIHKAYLEAGTDIIYSNTFGANSFKFDNVEEIIVAGIRNARRAVKDSGKQAYVALDIGPTGKLLKPMGTLDFEEAVSVFAEEVRAGVKAGADLIAIETMSDIYEMKAAVLAAKENSDLPIIATAAFGENGKMLTGASPEIMAAVMEGLRVDAFGMNCGLGPYQMEEMFNILTKVSSSPLVLKPNAGLPKSVGGKTVYDIGPNQFAEKMAEMVAAGAWIVGGCCGTTPFHIKALYEKCKNIPVKPLEEKDICAVTSYSNYVTLGDRPVIIGERINPTGKSKFKQALRDNNMAYILDEAVKQSDSGAHILDVNVGLPEIDEVAMMKNTVSELQSILPLPLQIDTTDPIAMETAMRIYNGKPMINSVNGKTEVMNQIFPLVQKYGGTVVGLCLDEDGIPNSTEGRLAIAEKIYKTAESYGIKRKDIVIDALTMTMSTDTNSANITLGAVKGIKAQGGRTVLGVSNISFGLPQRELVNSAFFTLAMQAGLSSGIINPNSASMRAAYDTYCVLAGYDDQCMDYCARYAVAAPVQTVVTSASAGNGTAPSAAASPATGSTPPATAAAPEMDLKQCIIKGLKDKAYKATLKALESKAPMAIINDDLVPALNEVGKGFEKGTIFLPQLLMSADAASNGFAAIKEEVQKKGISPEKKGTIIVATVKGDIHDIGKNILKVLLENYSYNVIDLGKDVPPEAIVEKVKETKAPLVGLSALMTTTVVSMEETIKQLRKEAPWCKVMVGGAVLTQEYADMIGADFYGKDAMQSVYYAEKLFS